MSVETLLLGRRKYLIFAVLFFSFYLLIGKIVGLNHELRYARSQISDLNSEIYDFRQHIEDIENEKYVYEERIEELESQIEELRLNRYNNFYFNY